MKIVEQSCRLLDWSGEDLYRRCERAGRVSHKSEEKIAPGTAEKFVRKMVKLGHESVFEFARCSLVEFLHCSIKPSEVRTNVRTLRESAKRHGEDSIYRILARSVSRKYPLFFEDVHEKNDFWDIEEKSDWLEWTEEGRVEKNPSLDWLPVHIVTNRAISHQLVRYRKDVVFIQESQRYCKYKGDVIFIDPSDYFEEGTWEGNEARAVWENHMARCEDKYNQFLIRGYSAEAARLVLPNSTKTELIMYAKPSTWMHFFDQRCGNHADKAMRTLACMIRDEMKKAGVLHHG